MRIDSVNLAHNNLPVEREVQLDLDVDRQSIRPRGPLKGLDQRLESSVIRPRTVSEVGSVSKVASVSEVASVIYLGYACVDGVAWRWRAIAVLDPRVEPSTESSGPVGTLG